MPAACHACWEAHAMPAEKHLTCLMPAEKHLTCHACHACWEAHVEKHIHIMLHACLACLDWSCCMACAISCTRSNHYYHQQVLSRWRGNGNDWATSTLSATSCLAPAPAHFLSLPWQMAATFKLIVWHCCQDVCTPIEFERKHLHPTTVSLTLSFWYRTALMWGHTIPWIIIIKKATQDPCLESRVD